MPVPLRFEWRVGRGANGLPTLLSVSEIPLGYRAIGVNAIGDIVGTAATSPARPFLLASTDLSIQLLPLISKATWGDASAINELGEIVGTQGYLVRGQSVARAVLWRTPSSVVDLNSLASLGKSESLSIAWDLNDAGDIIAGIENSSTSVIRGCILVKQ
jgi:uncharacterized membrane protein